MEIEEITPITNKIIDYYSKTDEIIYSGLKLRKLAETTPNLKVPEGTLRLLNINYYESDNKNVFSRIGIFENCTNLISIALPDSIMIIDTRTFANCKSLKTVIISDNVANIAFGYDIFIGCDSLEYLSIPEHIIPKLTYNDKKIYYKLYQKKWNKIITDIITDD